MQFDSLTFVLFFITVILLYYATTSWTARKAVLLVASYIFYSAWNPFFIVLIAISTIVDWLVARRMFDEPRRGRRRLLLATSLLVNLGLLSYFKYAGFLLDSFVSLVEKLGYSYTPPSLDIVLPVGISFYTFQSLSYTIDIYRKKLDKTYSLLDFSLFVSFFPQLVAGPIVRASHFLPQCLNAKTLDASKLGLGLALIVMGLFQKVVLADGILAPAVDSVFENAGSVGSFESWLSVFSFSGQIYFDFNGYSCCAIGAALCLGFRIPDNFRAPYAAVGFSDFWSRWHISLSTWFRDYLYIPIGGNRRGTGRTLSNLLFTMLVAGLWHGASWMFVIWGGLHGAYLVTERVLQGKAQFLSRIFQSSLGVLSLSLITFVVVSVTWIFFRSQDMQTAMLMFSALGRDGTQYVLGEQNVLLVVATLVGFVVYHQLMRKRTIYGVLANLPGWFISLVLSCLLLVVLVKTGGDERAFIYFQF